MEEYETYVPVVQDDETENSVTPVGSEEGNGDVKTELDDYTEQWMQYVKETEQAYPNLKSGDGQWIKEEVNQEEARLKEELESRGEGKEEGGDYLMKLNDNRDGEQMEMDTFEGGCQEVGHDRDENPHSGSGSYGEDAGCNEQLLPGSCGYDEQLHTNEQPLLDVHGYDTQQLLASAVSYGEQPDCGDQLFPGSSSSDQHLSIGSSGLDQLLIEPSSSDQPSKPKEKKRKKVCSC